MTREEHPGGPIAFKLLQGYLWHPKELGAVALPDTLPSGANIVIDNIEPPFAFFEDGTWTGTQTFYQLTVLEIFQEWPSNDAMRARALIASQELNLILNATPAGVGWSLSEDLRPA
jgi:hypothetical protein